MGAQKQFSVPSKSSALSSSFSISAARAMPSQVRASRARYCTVSGAMMLSNSMRSTFPVPLPLSPSSDSFSSITRILYPCAPASTLSPSTMADWRFHLSDCSDCCERFIT